MESHGKVIWYHPELQTALIEREDGFTVGSVERGTLALGETVSGELRTQGLCELTRDPSGGSVTFLVEADALSEEEANELLGYVRD